MRILFISYRGNTLYEFDAEIPMGERENYDYMKLRFAQFQRIAPPN